MSLDIWMRENTLTYVWLGSYAFALAIFAIEIYLIRNKRKSTLKRLKMMQDAEGES